MDSKRIGRMVRFHRKRSGLTQRELADFAQIGKTAVYDVEKGKPTIQIDTLQKILYSLKIKLFFEGPLMRVFEEQDREEG